MNIFGIYLSQFYFKIYSKRTKLHHLNFFLRGACPRTPLRHAPHGALRHATDRPISKQSWAHPLANSA